MEIRFGEQPLAQTTAAAAGLRRLIGLLLSQEHPHPAVDDMLARLPAWERELAASAPADPAPRVGAVDDPDRRIYLDHAFDIGAYNPCFPEYRFDTVDSDVATGRVSFPVAYEGPPGLVHGGFLGVFFDCVVQQHSCTVGLTGKTRSLAIRYRRPTPIRTELVFEITRAVGETGVESTATLLLHGEVLCRAEVATVAAQTAHLSGAGYGKRRVRG